MGCDGKATCPYNVRLEFLTKWLSCNGELWGVGPTVVFASAATLFLHNELQTTFLTPGDHVRVSPMEKSLVSTMVIGMLALMIHLWVCGMRFFQYYLDTLIHDSPNMLLEMTTVGILGSQNHIASFGPFTSFLRQQQPQIHITVCWFLSLCYADYVRKNYCQRFNLPYLEEWQAELHDKVASGAHHAAEKVTSCVASLHRRLCHFRQSIQPVSDAATVHTGSPISRDSSVHISACSQCKSTLKTTDYVLFYEQNKQKKTDEACEARIINQATENTVDAIEKLRTFITLISWSKCGESTITVVPTALWAAAATVLAHRTLDALFRRQHLFRRVPVWERILQHLLFMWMVIYSLHLWSILVQIIKLLVGYCYIDDNGTIPEEDMVGVKLLQQSIIWVCGTMPAIYYLWNKPKPEIPPLMIWMTSSPWQRREMGPYGYYLSRPLSSLQSFTSVSIQHHFNAMRRAISDSRIIIKESQKKKRHSKSI